MNPAIFSLFVLVSFVAAASVAASAWVQHQRRQPAGSSSGPERLSLTGARRDPEGPADRAQLSDPERDRYLDSWQAIEAKFVHDPGQSVWEAQALLRRIVQQHGGGSRYTGAALAGVRSVLDANERGEASLDQLRRALLSQRKLLQLLLAARS